VARILIVGGGCRGRRFAAQMLAAGHAVRASTRSEAGRAAIERTGAECWVGTPERLATLRGALDNVTIACWMLAGARGTAEELRALHTSRLEFFLGEAIDTTVRGLIYDATAVAGAAGAGGALARGASGAGGPVVGGRSGAGDRRSVAHGTTPGDAAATVDRELLADGARIARSLAELNAIPLVVLGQSRGESRGEEGDERWIAAAAAAVDELLGG
jgi:hypothetical protein